MRNDRQKIIMEKILLRNIENPNSADINEYLKIGGYKSLIKTFEKRPKDIIGEITESWL